MTEHSVITNNNCTLHIQIVQKVHMSTPPPIGTSPFRRGLVSLKLRWSPLKGEMSAKPTEGYLRSSLNVCIQIYSNFFAQSPLRIPN